MTSEKERKGQGGFTLIELMAVVVIIGILATIVSVAIVTNVEKAKINAAVAQIANFKTALKLFKINHGFYPSTEQGLEALVQPPTTGRIPQDYPRNGYLDDTTTVPDDPWGTPYVYESPGSHGFDYEVTSLGADAMPGGEDGDADIESWSSN
jgi:general secretion pathway protein G